MDDGRAFIRCTSSNHTHESNQYWLKKNETSKGKKVRAAPRSVEMRNKMLADIPEELLEYAENRLVYSCLQGVF